MEPVILRAIERILAVLIGGLSVYLGYSLFLHLPEQTDSAGKIILPGNISIYLSRVGPGVFFALFGVVVVALSLHKAIIYSEPANSVPTTESDTTLTHQQTMVRYYSGLGESETKGERQALQRSRMLLRRNLFFLNTLPTVLRADLSNDQQAEINLTLPKIKLALMKPVWDQNWGDYIEFEKWALEGDEDSPPQGFENPAEYFHYGQKGVRDERAK
jgi:hypothetical protein